MNERSRSLFQKGVLIAGPLVTLLIASQALLNPADMMSNAFAIAVTTVSGFNEIRAQYGGFFLAVALVCLLSILGRIPIKMGLTPLAVAFGGVLFGRVISLLIDGIGVFGSYTAILKFLFLLDGMGLIFTLIALAV